MPASGTPPDLLDPPGREARADGAPGVGPPTGDAARLAAEPTTACLNCGAVLPGEFCPDCGQRDQPLRQPAHQFISESVSEYFGLDGRLWRSLGLLLFRPGALTVAYLDGRRMRYLRPLRLYLTATVVFFFLLAQQDPLADDGLEVVLEPVASDSTLRAEDLRGHLDDRQEAAGAAHAAVLSALVQLDGLGASAPLRALADSFAAQEGRLNTVEARVAWLPEDSLVAVSSLPPFLVLALADTGRVEAITEFDLEDSPLDHVPEWAKGSTMRQIEASESPVEREMLMNQYLASVLRQVPTALILILPVFAVLLKGLYAVGAGRAPRLRRRPSRAPGSVSWWRRALFAASLARWHVGRWRGRWRRHRRRRRAAKRRRPIRGALGRLRERVRTHEALRPRRVRRVRRLRQSLEGARRRYYAEHLVFALHVHAFTFLALVPILFLGVPSDAEAPPVMWAGVLLLLSIPLYFLVAQHRVYGQRWAVTVAKATVLGTVYSFLIGLGAAVAAGLAIRLG